jgi:hypothetical protein
MKVDHNAKTGVSLKPYDDLDEIMLDIAGRQSNYNLGLGLPDNLPLMPPQPQLQPDGDQISTSMSTDSHEVHDHFFESLGENDIISFAGIG